MRATEEGNLETELSLIAEDAVFLLPDQPPMRGREAFCRRPALGPWTSLHRKQARYSGDSCRWRRLLLESAFSDGDSAAGHNGALVTTLSVFRKERDGRWILFRDANMLKTV